MSSTMEITEAPALDTDQSHWHHATVSGIDEKMNAIMNLLEDDDSPLQNAQMNEKRKEEVRKMVEDLRKSYRSLVDKYNRLISVSTNALDSASRSHSINGRSQLDGMKHSEVLGSSDDSQLEVIGSNTESTVEDAEIEYDGDTLHSEHLQTFVNNLIPKDEVKFKMSKLVEENIQLQTEFIRRNTEKREIIRKLQNQVSKLTAENNSLQRHLSFYARKKQHVHVQVNSPTKKTMLLDKFFRGCS